MKKEEVKFKPLSLEEQREHNFNMEVGCFKAQTSLNSPRVHAGLTDEEQISVNEYKETYLEKDISQNKIEISENKLTIETLYNRWACLRGKPIINLRLSRFKRTISYSFIKDWGLNALCTKLYRENDKEIIKILSQEFKRRGSGGLKECCKLFLSFKQK